MKRFIDCSASDLREMNKSEIIDSIKASEGRVILTELTLIHQNPMVSGITDAEVKSGMGSDLLLYNKMDVFDPKIPGIDDCENPISKIKRMTGKLIGVNLEPVDESEKIIGEAVHIKEGRVASQQTFLQTEKLGIDFVLLTGNPGTGVTNRKMVEIMKQLDVKNNNQLIVMAGKMHAAGSNVECGPNIISREIIKEFIDAGASVICVPAPGTVPGVTLDIVKKWIDYIHECGALAMTAIGTSQEGSPRSTIENIALMCKMAGADIHHLGDASINMYENIYYYSLVVKGKRHTLRSMCKSPLR